MEALDRMMADSSRKLVKGLIDRTLENMNASERRAFVLDLFSSLSSDAQQNILREVILEVAGVPGSGMAEFLQDANASRPGALLRENGPLMMCCNMMIDIDRAEDLALLDAIKPTRLFNALADETRIKVIKLLSTGEMAVDAISKALRIPQPTASHHLKILREAEVLRSEKRGRCVYYSLVNPVEVG